MSIPEITQFDLLVGQSENEAVVPIRWCVNREFALFLEERCRGAWLLLVVVHERAGEVDRKIVPFDRAIEYVAFNRPGKHTVLATVLFFQKYYKKPRGEVLSSLKQKLLSRYRGSSKSFSHRLFDFHYGDDAEDCFMPMWATEHTDCVVAKGKGSVDVVVPDGFFAKEPPKWLDKWAHLLWTRPSYDSCDFRKHVLFSIFQPLPLAFIWFFKGAYALVRIALKLLWALAALSLGMRLNSEGYGVNLRAVFVPFRERFRDVWNASFRYDERSKRGGSWVLSSKGEERSPLWFILTPAFWVGMFLLIFSTSYLNRETEISFALFSKLSVISTVFVMLGLFILAIVANRLADLLFRLTARGPDDPREERRLKRSLARQKRAIEKAERREKRREERVRARVKPLICTPTPAEVNIAALPRDRQTVHLRFQELKSKVCRPRAF